jgi:hypothetical protein
MQQTPNMNVWQVDPIKHPNAQLLVDACSSFFSEIEDLTPGKDLEDHLNTHHGPGTTHYESISQLMRVGLAEGWVASTQVGDGPHYRRSKIILPAPETRFFSLTSVWMDSSGRGEEVLSGEYHKHVYGEINCIIPFGEGAQMKGMQGWMGRGWTSPGAGTHHFPQVCPGRDCVHTGG